MTPVRLEEKAVFTEGSAVGGYKEAEMQSL